MSLATPMVLEGTLNIVCARAQREQLLVALDASAGELVLDLSAIEAVDSAGVQLLLATRRSLEERGGALHLRAVAPVVREVLDAYGLHGLMRLTAGGAAAAESDR